MTSRRTFLRQSLITSAAVAAAPTFGFNILHKDLKPADVIIGHNGFTYKVDKNWAKISVNTNPLFNCHEMVRDSKGRLIMIGDNVKNNILIFDASGKLLDFWGNAFPGGHGLSISHEGEEDFLFMTDCGYFQDRTGKWTAQSGQVVKTTTDGRLVFSIGHPKTIGIYKQEEKFQPTETAIAPNGDIYVADGYGSDYILHYDKNGKYIRHFGGHNNSNPDHNLRNAHGVTVDTRDPNNLSLICTSREENCFKVFTMDGKFVKRIDLPGMYVCRAVIDDRNIYAGVCWSKGPDGHAVSDTGFVTILDAQNKVVSSPGGTSPVYKNGMLEASKQSPEAVFHHGHDVCVDSDKSVYVCQWNANYTPPVKLTRGVMTMPAAQIVRLLLTYRSILVPELDVLNTRPELTTISISSEYSFITLEVRDKADDQLVCSIKFELDSKSGKLIELYIKDKSLQETLTTKLKKKKFPGFDDKGLEPNTWIDEIRWHIEQADEVAGVAVNCTNGDDYRPGNFSEIEILDDRLVLTQVNRMNSRSLDHKHDYSLRDLKFIIPLSKNFTAPVVNYKINKMYVDFHDGSSANNKRCGDKIEKVLEDLSKK